MLKTNILKIKFMIYKIRYLNNRHSYYPLIVNKTINLLQFNLIPLKIFYLIKIKNKSIHKQIKIPNLKDQKKKEIQVLEKY